MGGDGGVDGSDQFCSAVLKQEEKVACLGWHKDCVEVSAGSVLMSACQAVGEKQPKPKHHTPASVCYILRVHTGVFSGRGGEERLVGLLLCGSFGFWQVRFSSDTLLSLSLPGE